MNTNIKKTLILAALLSVAGIVSAQSYTQKWNSLYNRTEFYDSYGRMIGYSKYNELYNRMECTLPESNTNKHVNSYSIVEMHRRASLAMQNIIQVLLLGIAI